MKITRSGPTTGPAHRVKIAARADASGGPSFAEHVDARPSASLSLSPAAPLAALNGVLAVQEVPDASAERHRAIRRGDSILDELRKLQVGLVDGWVSEGMLQRLTRLLEAARPGVGDARLDEVLDDIELRAAVELAKLRRGRS
jgi:class II flagellar assembly regulator FliX